MMAAPMGSVPAPILQVNLTAHFIRFWLTFVLGPLVRISVYLTNALVGAPSCCPLENGALCQPSTRYAAILLFYSKEKVGDSVWTQVISVYALTIAAGVSIFKSRLTRIHAILTIAIAGSPLSLYIVVNALLSMLAGGLRPGHSLASVFGGNRKFHVRIIARLIVLGAFAVWFTLLVYTLSPSHHNHFAQFSCEGSIVYGGNAIIGSIFVLPIYVFLNIGKLSPVIITSPAQLTVIAWLVAIVLKRHEIWRGGGFKFHFQRVWYVIYFPLPDDLRLTLLQAYRCGELSIPSFLYGGSLASRLVAHHN